MFKSSYRLPFRLAGIPLYIHVSFIFILPLMVLGATQYLAAIVRHPMFGLDPERFHGPIALVLGFFSAIGLFVCVVLHELGHAITAQRYGVKVRRITLWFLGGVAEFEEMPRQRGAEAIVAIAGPLVSFGLAVLFYALALVIPRASAQSLWLVCYYLMYVNGMLGLFNLIPALPLDGGRILRSLLAMKMPYVRATVVSGNVAKIIAVGMGVFGLFSSNLWLIILAFFIFSAVNSETQYSVIVETLRGMNVADLMNRDVIAVPASITVGELTRYILTQRHHRFPVVDDDGRVIGIVGVEQLQNVDPNMMVAQVMLREIPNISERASALDAFTRMGQNEIGQLIVMDDSSRMVGIITKADLMRAIQVRMLGFQAAGGSQPVYAPRPPASPQGSFGYTSPNAPRDSERHARPL